MDIEEIKDEYRARVEPRGKSISEILEEAAKETKAYKDLEEENKTLKDNVEFLHSCLDDRDKSIAIMQEENEKLKSDLANIQCEFGFECDECEYWKREIKKHKPCLIKEEYVFNLGDYDYMILTSTTPQLKIIKKKNKGASTFTIDGFTAVGKTFSSLADEEDLYEDIK